MPRMVVIAGILLVGALLLGGLLMPVGTPRLSSIEYDQNPLGAVLTLAVPTFLAGIFSFLSPCVLPILPAYFAFTFEARRHHMLTS